MKMNITIESYELRNSEHFYDAIEGKYGNHVISFQRMDAEDEWSVFVHDSDRFPDPMGASKDLFGALMIAKSLCEEMDNNFSGV
jgi:hypothetical protein